MSEKPAAPSPRVTVKRIPARGHYDRPTIDAILDEGLICHVGFSLDSQPFVIPTIYGRDGDRVFFHGSAASRMLRAIRGGIPVCLTVTLLDGLVLARSAFHHSMNYRSVVILGTAVEVVDREAKIAALKTISDRVIPGRWEEVREPNQSEVTATSVLTLPISEASAKLRTGGPIDDEEDYALPVWAGQLPFELEVQPPIADTRLPQSIGVPGYIANYRRSR
ncbi:MAG TPA: pyridoxamine 5'-phosphate oxidase family protein [Candidatus Binataceae bacterium]|nr:pyridoxamine 5'-phosphate oxidase family protein [Candidatus Binataceae bacterium]